MHNFTVPFHLHALKRSVKKHQATVATTTLPGHYKAKVTSTTAGHQSTVPERYRIYKLYACANESYHS